MVEFDGHLIAAGGAIYYDPTNHDCYASVERLDVAHNKWVFIANMTEARDSFAMAVLGNFLYVFGGTSYGDVLSSAEIFGR